MPFPVTDQNQIKATAGSLAKDLDRILLRGQQFKAWLDTYTDAELIANWNFAQADINDLRSTLSDVDLLRTVYQGTATQASLKDFRAFAKRLYAFGSIT
jgi:hypothetical protein